MNELEKHLTEIVGDAHVLVDADLRAQYETDWTRRFTGEARCVVRPADTAQVAAVVRACAEAGAPIVVQGGNTGLVGGGVPGGGEVLLSLSRLTAIEDVDPLEAQVTAGAGVTLEKLQQHARPHGLDVGVDLAARSAATVGGLVATNAGGIRVVRYGSMREQLTGVEAVLADGTVVSRLSGLTKDNTGYDLTQLLAGSEGTLAVITRVRLRLVPLLPARTVALVAVDGVEGALALLTAARAGLPGLSAAELFLPAGLELVRAYGRLPDPFDAPHPAYLVLESAGRADATDEVLEVLGECEAVLDATVASDVTGVARLWAYRETHTEAISAAGVPVKLDVSVPLRELPALVAALPDTVAAVAPAARPIVFGHLGEGNLHVNVLDAGDAAEQVTDAVLRLVASLRGSISSEHGVGRAKAEWLGLSRSAAEIDVMRRVKAALDPAGLLNPGVLLR
ncbi:FAD-binding oxidoreductase [Spirilliplanes yamanashiensis]|uniref:Oxidoreductase n=1 Tax=Spirilliplanes yamanashiensis TaxID=42233 RepID=A0A8J3YBZ1_9ACTN|nr:FAD-binding oxidoreductase [Spirilliplanes yamanashiensis]MDP9816359.1 FAD/FMN-containing dehydrogenase [Spirilliplanes yamanashiensis]GIJ05886.1 oxidoreductase [Spirilliplanes yamanashiensis]